MPTSAGSESFLARARRRRAERGLRFTREGRVFVLVTLGVGAGAVNTGNNLLFLVLGLMLSLIVLSGVLSDLVLWWVSVERRLPERAYAGAPCLVEIALSNQKRWLPSFSLEVEDQADGEPTDRRCYFLKIAPSGEQVAAYRRTPRRRGFLRLVRFRVSTRYPFGLFEKWRLLDDEAELLVYPRLVPVRDVSALARGVGQESAAHLPGPGHEIAGLREYREGDEARAIHWRRSASLGRIVVRERERDSGARFTVLVDNARPEGADATWDEAFEDAVSRAASIATIALSNGAAVDVVARGQSSAIALPGMPPDVLLRFLALLGTVPAQGAEPLPRAPASSVIVRAADRAA